jgi:hypothetical protein
MQGESIVGMDFSYFQAGCIIKRKMRLSHREGKILCGRTDSGREIPEHQFHGWLRPVYNPRAAIAKSPDAPVLRIVGPDRFHPAGRKKANYQWNIYCIVHNLKKVDGYGP